MGSTSSSPRTKEKRTNHANKISLDVLDNIKKSIYTN